MSDKFAMREGVADEVLGRRIACEQCRPVVAREKRDRVEQHRRPAVDLVPARDARAVRERDPADLRCNQFPDSAGGVDRLGQRLEDPRIRAVGREDSELASGEARRAVEQDTERPGRGKVGERLCCGLGGRRKRQPQAIGNRGCEAAVDMEEMRYGAGANVGAFDLRQLEDKRVADMLLLDRGLAHEELPRLAIVVGEALGADAPLGAFGLFGEARKAARGILARAAVRRSPAVRLVIGAADGVSHRHMTVLLEMRHRAFGRIDRDMGEIGAAEPFDLRVEIGEIAALQQRIVREVDAGDDVLGAEGDLLGLGEEIVDDAVENEAADGADRHLLLGDEFGRIEHVEFELVREGVVEQLNAEFPFGKIAAVDRIPQVAAMEIGVGAVDLDRLVPHHRLEALLGLPVEFDEGRFALRVDEAEGVDAEAFHRAKRAGDRAVRHHPHDHVEALGHQAHEIPEIVVGRLRLREGPIGLGLHRMDEVGEFHRILDEEDRDIVADEIPIAFLGVELHREAAHVACEVERAFRTRDR